MKRLTFALYCLLIVNNIFSQENTNKTKAETYFKTRTFNHLLNKTNFTFEYNNNPSIQEKINNLYLNYQLEIMNQLKTTDSIDSIKIENTWNELVNKIIPLKNSYQNDSLSYPQNNKAPNGPCVNMDFEMGSTNGWSLYRGFVDGLSPYSYSLSSSAAPGVNHQIYNGGIDPIVGISRVAPGGSYSIRLGDGIMTGNGAARMTQTFLVSPNNMYFTYQYAVVFQSPTDHLLNEQPYFTVRIYTQNGTSIPCGEYSVIANAASASTYQSVVVNGIVVYYKDWSTVFTNLSAYIGQNVTIEFTSGDCTKGGHYGYAYLDASCTTQEIKVNPSSFCQGQSTTLTAPPNLANYQWNTGETTQSITVNSSGTYSCLLTPIQGNSCSFSMSMPIEVFPKPIANFNVSTQLCQGQNIVFTNLSSVSAPSTIQSYLWDFGDGIQTTASNGTITGIPNTSGTHHTPSHIYSLPGTYNITLTIITNNGCSSTYNQTIVINAKPEIQFSISPSTCLNASNGSITTQIIAGNEPFIFNWSNGQQTQNLSNLTIGNYELSVTDTYGCIITQSANIYAQPTMNINLVEQKNVSCFGGSDGTLTVNTSGGNPEYTYSINNSQTQNSSNFSNLSAANYTIIATDKNGCEASQNYVITQPLLPLELIGKTSNPLCIGDSNGEISIQISGGTSPYSCIWSNGETDTNLQNLPSGNYSVNVTDAQNCPISIIFQLEEPKAIALKLDAFEYPSGTNISCYGLNDGMINLNVEGGTTPYHIIWSNGANTHFINSLTSGNYTVEVIDSNGCKAQASLYLNQPLALNGSINPSIYPGGTNVTGCLADGHIDLNIEGGNPSYEYNWSTGEQTQDLMNLKAGYYSVNIKDVNGCTTFLDATLTQSNTLAISLDAYEYPSGTNISCYNLSDGNIQATVNGGVPPYSFQWSNGNINPELHSVSAGIYTLTVTDATGCIITEQIELIEPSAFVSSIHANYYPSGTNISCYGEDDGSISILVQGSNGGYSYSWNNGASNPNITQVPAGIYEVTVTDINGCSMLSSIQLIQPFQLDAQAILSSHGIGINVSACKPDGFIDVSVQGGNYPYNYYWSNGEYTQDINNLYAGNYTLIITDVNGCKYQLDTVLVQGVGITASIEIISNHNGNPISCNGSSDAILNGIATGGLAPYTFSWSNLNGNTIGSQASIESLPAGFYQLFVTDANGCIAQESILLNNPPPLNVQLLSNQSFQGFDVSCYGGSNGSIELSVWGGSAPLVYTWTDSQGNLISNNQNIENLSAGVYQVSVTDVNGCNSKLTRTILEPPPIQATPTITSNYNGQHISCFNASDGFANVSISGGIPTYEILWLNSSEQVLSTTSSLKNVPTGQYQIIIKDRFGCPYNTSIHIDQPTPILVEIQILSNYNGMAVSCPNTNDGSVIAMATGGTFPYQYQWNTGENSLQIDNLNVGTYTVNVVDINGCMASQMTVLEALPKPAINVPPSLVSCQNESIWIDYPQCEGCIAKWSFSNGFELQSNDPFPINFDQIGCYDLNLSVTSAYGCKNEILIENYICKIPSPIASFEIEKNVLSNYSTGTLFINTSTNATSSVWNFGDQTPFEYTYNAYHNFMNFSDFEQTMYTITLTVTNGDNCIDSTTRTIVIQPELSYFVPNAFTPNSDAFNNVFLPVFGSGFDKENYQFIIFNRWGEVIFKTNEMEIGWDGTYQGIHVQEGIYTWKLEVGYSMNASKLEQYGHVTLLKGL